MIKSYPTQADYNSATLSTIESQVSMIETSREIIVDGVNVITTSPEVGDLVMLDESNNIVFLKGGSWIQKSLIPSAWTHVGYVYMRHGDKVGVIDKDATDEKFCDVLMYTISSITSTDVSLTLYDKNGDAHSVDITLSSAAINSTTAGEIDAAVRAAAIDDQDWWAYLSDGAIVVQCDSWTADGQYNCGMTGGSISFTSLTIMPAETRYFRRDGSYSRNRGIMNTASGVAYWSTNGRTPSAQEPVPAAGGDSNPVTQAAFESSEYCALLRSIFGTYESYIDSLRVEYPQQLGTFSLPSGEELSAAYALLTVPTAGGGTKYRFPAMAYCRNVAYNHSMLAAACWHLPSSLEGCYLLDDDTLSLLQPSIAKMGTSAISNSSVRLLAERYDVAGVRVFNGGYGTLGGSIGRYRLRTQAVTLFRL